MNNEMKPCRRCGLYVTPDGIEVTQTDTGTYTARFECPDCGEVAETCMRHSSEDSAVADVIIEWNRRWIDPALIARIEELIAVRDIRIDRDTPAELLTYDTTKSDAPVMLACTVAAFLMRRFSVMTISPDGIGLRLKKMPRPRSKR